MSTAHQRGIPIPSWTSLAWSRSSARQHAGDNTSQCISSLISSLGWKFLEQRQCFVSIVFFHKVVYFILKTNLQRPVSIHFRNSSHLIQPGTRTNTFKNSPDLYASVICYPQNYILFTKPKHFSQSVKQWCMIFPNHQQLSSSNHPICCKSTSELCLFALKSSFFNVYAHADSTGASCEEYPTSCTPDNLRWLGNFEEIHSNLENLHSEETPFLIISLFCCNL